jgi:hypothetical protein
MEEKVNFDRKFYDETLKMLRSSGDDFELACSNLKNSDVTSVALLILAKELLFSKRSQFIDKFGNRIAAIYTYTDMNLNYSWHSIFEQINQTALTKLEKELVSDIIEDTILKTLKSYSEFDFIKSLDITLDWGYKNDPGFSVMSKEEEDEFKEILEKNK